MIRARYDEDEHMGYISFDGDNFLDIIDEAKNNNLRYKDGTSEWCGCAPDVYDCLVALSHIESVTISKTDEQNLKANRYLYAPVTTQVIKRSVDPKWISRFPPVKGKAPHENFQVECIERAISQNRLALFLGMGSGKTIVMIQALNHFFEYGEIDRVLIVSPPEGVVNWKHELLNFSDLTMDDIVIASAQRNRLPLEDGDPKVIITTYRHFLTMSDDYYKKKKGTLKKGYRTSQIPFDKWSKKIALVLDESHNIKGSQARQTKVVDLHKGMFTHRYLLTGTPTPNNFSEIHPQIKVLDDALVPSSYSQWLPKIAELGTRFSNYAVKSFKQDEIDKWEKRFSPWVVRYSSEDILDLPELYLHKTYVEMPNKHKAIYQGITEYTMTREQDKADNAGIRPDQMRSALIFIMMAIDNPMLLKSHSDIEGFDPKLYKKILSWKFTDHGKLEALESVLAQAIDNEKKKVIVFDFHPLTIDSLAQHFQKYLPLVIHGQSTPTGMDVSEYRSSVLQRFRTNQNCPLLIASSRVLSTAVNLQEATMAVYFSRDFSYLNWSQSQKRIHRIGQQHTVRIVPMIFEDSLDVVLDKSLDRKEDLDKRIFRKNVLTLSEWRAIFRGKIAASPE